MTTPMLDRFYEFLDRPLRLWSRVVLALLVVPLVLAFSQPLWRISMEAPQYPKGLWMEIYAHKVEAGNKGQHLDEINTLNHYIGMQKIDRAALTDLDWMPFALGALVLLTLRVAAIGNVRMALDLLVLAGYVAAFAGARFVYRMWAFGHQLDPKAAVKVDPFMPALFGTKQIANFTTHSFPQLGTILVGIFLGGLLFVCGWHLFTGRRSALRELGKLG
jgi:copper chaperone NosL